jgi:RNA-directed DNA polymerase
LAAIFIPYLHQLDLTLHRYGRKIIRYADDFVVLCQGKEEAEEALAEIQLWTDQNGLQLSQGKTHIGNCLETGQGFEFLGYRFEAGCRYVRSKSLKKFKDNIRSKTRRTRGDSIENIISDLNPTIKGWFEYFKHAHHYTFNSLDGFIRRRLRAVLRKQKKRPGSGKTGRDHRQWPNAFFAERGLFTMYGAYVGLVKLGVITGNGQMLFSLNAGFSPCMVPTFWRANPDEETTDWRAVCGRTACTVRRAGRGLPLSDPYHV